MSEKSEMQEPLAETMPEGEELIVTPESIERRLMFLAREINVAYQNLEKAEHGYHEAKTSYEISMARTRVEYSGQTRAGKNYTVGEREDMALIDNAQLFVAESLAEAVVRAARANVKRLEVQADITRSMGTSVRSALAIV